MATILLLTVETSRKREFVEISPNFYYSLSDYSEVIHILEYSALLNRFYQLLIFGSNYRCSNEVIFYYYCTYLGKYENLGTPLP